MLTGNESHFYKARVGEVPELSPSLLALAPLETVPLKATDPQITSLFPNLSRYQLPTTLLKTPLKVGVILSGGQAPGGHNVIAGLQRRLQELNPDSELIGFLNGPSGLIKNKFKPLDKDDVLSYLNTGGFDMIGSGRTKIETEEDFSRSLETVLSHKLDGLVIIGGDDSNTNAALLAEYFLAHKAPCTVVGCPKTIDGDLKNDSIEQSFGFDTATKIYSETVGNLMKDVLSSQKYWFFVRLMGRSASHITLEVALQTHPNLTLISEERRSLDDIVQEIADLIEARHQEGKDYGIVLIPEGLIEFLPELPEKYFPESSFKRDPHGNLEVSKIETERWLIELVRQKLKPETPFSPQPLFLGYEARSAAPSLFDATYCYQLGVVAALLIAQQATGHMAIVSHLKEPISAWQGRSLPLLPLLKMESRKGKLKPVIEKALVDLSSPLYTYFREEGEAWKRRDAYRSPGPIQFWGPEVLTQAKTWNLSALV